MVESAFDPVGSEVLGHDSVLQSLETWIFNFVEVMIVQNWYEWVVIRDDVEMW